MKLVFATNNINKLKEIKAILEDKIDILSLSDIDCHVDIPETSDTLQGNALLKARYVYTHYRMNCFADDTGLEVEALNGAPGIHTARYANDEEHDSEANMKLLLHNLLYEENRKAQFRTVIALILNGKEYFFEGCIKGNIIREKRGEKGFGYDPVFISDGYDKTFAELNANIKNSISHRAKAVEQLCKFLMNKQ